MVIAGALGLEGMACGLENRLTRDHLRRRSAEIPVGPRGATLKSGLRLQAEDRASESDALLDGECPPLRADPPAAGKGPPAPVRPEQPCRIRRSAAGHRHHRSALSQTENRLACLLDENQSPA